jgi:hypothetical protein
VKSSHCVSSHQGGKHTHTQHCKPIILKAEFPWPTFLTNLRSSKFWTSYKYAAKFKVFLCWWTKKHKLSRECRVFMHYVLQTTLQDIIFQFRVRSGGSYGGWSGTGVAFLTLVPSFHSHITPNSLIFLSNAI